MENRLKIRPVELRDARDINEIRITPEVAENLLALPSESVVDNEQFIAQKTPEDHLLCAEITDSGVTKVVGLAGLHVRKLARENHCAVIGLMVHKQFHGQGIGGRLMASLMDLSDNWLMLKRLQLTVFTDNQAGIALYKKFGFVEEGIMRYAVKRRGAYSDIILMARYQNGLK